MLLTVEESTGGWAITLIIQIHHLNVAIGLFRMNLRIRVRHLSPE